MYPYRKQPWTYYVINRPLTTLVESLTLPPWGKNIPSEYELGGWRRKTKEFAPLEARFIIIILMFILCIFELLVVLSVSSLIKLTVFDLLKDYKMLLSTMFLFYGSVLMLNRPIIWRIELFEVIMSTLLNRDIYIYEWIKFIAFSVLYDIIVFLIILMAK